MTFIVVTPNTTYGRELAVEIRGIGARAGDMMPAMELIAKSFHDLQKHRFDSSGPRWQMLAQSTIDTKEALGGALYRNASSILIRFGDLYEAMALGQGPGAVHIVTPEYIEVGTDLDYAEYHQVGGGNLPKREMVHDPDPATYAVWLRILEDYVMRGVLAEMTTIEMLTAR